MFLLIKFKGRFVWSSRGDNQVQLIQELLILDPKMLMIFCGNPLLLQNLVQSEISPSDVMCHTKTKVNNMTQMLLTLCSIMEASYQY